MKNNHAYFSNRDCEYFPCHKGADPEFFNCLFCFCPLYLIPECGGDFILRKGVKDCTECLKPHIQGGYERILSILKDRAESLRTQSCQ